MFFFTDLSWHWNFYIQLIFGAFVQFLHFWMPECRSTIIMDREAKRRRKEGKEEVYGPNELKKPRISLKEAGKIWLRPFEMFVREPIVLCLSVLSGFSDGRFFPPRVYPLVVGVAHATLPITKT